MIHTLRKMLEIIDIKKSYRDHEVLQGISFSVKEGEICGLMGVNGSGKSTLFKIIANLVLADSGQVLYNNQVKKTNDGFGVMIENPAFYPYMTGFQNLYAFSKLYNNIGKEDINSALKKVGLLNVKQTFGQYSLGMKQRLYFAFAILANPKVLLLDEPFSGIDYLSVDILSYLIKDAASRGVSVLISGHQVEQMKDLCHSVYLLDQGKIVFHAQDIANTDFKQLLLDYTMRE